MNSLTHCPIHPAFRTDHIARPLADTTLTVPPARVDHSQQHRCTTGPEALRRQVLGTLNLYPLSRSGRLPVRQHEGMASACFTLALVQQGQLRLRQNGRDADCVAGEMLLLDNREAFEVTLATPDCSGFWLEIPASMLLTRVANIRALTVRNMDLSRMLAGFAVRLINEALALPPSYNRSVANHLASAIVDALCAAFEEYSGQRSLGNTRSVNVLDSAKAVMLQRLEDPELTIEAVAGQVGTSHRTLNRLFALENTTPTRWLWAKRLELSKTLLQDGHSRRVTDVALDCGFRDFSHFSRAFKARFGITPRSLLEKTACSVS